MIHVCYGLYDRVGRYSKFTGTSMLSMFDNTTAAITVHILHDNTLTADNRKNFQIVADNYKQNVNFYNVEKLCADKIAEFRTKMGRIMKTQYSIGTLYRFAITDLLPEELDKVIYLDSDTIVNLDIAALWQIELEDHPLAGVSEQANGVNVKHYFALCREGIVAEDKYFNAGVLIMNLDSLRYRREEIANAFDFVATHPQYEFFDQDILNYCFAKETLQLPLKFNRMIPYARIAREPLQQNICHYYGQSADFNMKDRFSKLFMEYFLKTPWFGLDTIQHFGEYIQAIHSQSQNKLLNFFATTRGKKRGFYVELDNPVPFLRLFQVDRSEKCLLASKPDSLRRMINDLRNSNGKKIYVLFVRRYSELKAELDKLGFVESIDFFNATEFFSAEQGMPLDTCNLIQAM